MISWKTVGIALASILGSLLVVWCGWVSMSVSKLISADRDFADLRKQDEMIRLEMGSLEGRISGIWRNGIAPLRRFHMEKANWPNGEVIDSHKD